MAPLTQAPNPQLPANITPKTVNSVQNESNQLSVTKEGLLIFGDRTFKIKALRVEGEEINLSKLSSFTGPELEQIQQVFSEMIGKLKEADIDLGDKSVKSIKIEGQDKDKDLKVRVNNGENSQSISADNLLPSLQKIGKVFNQHVTLANTPAQINDEQAVETTGEEDSAVQEHENDDSDSYQVREGEGEEAAVQEHEGDDTGSYQVREGEDSAVQEHESNETDSHPVREGEGAGSDAVRGERFTADEMEIEEIQDQTERSVNNPTSQVEAHQSVAPIDKKQEKIEKANNQLSHILKEIIQVEGNVHEQFTQVLENYENLMKTTYPNDEFLKKLVDGLKLALKDCDDLKNSMNSLMEEKEVPLTERAVACLTLLSEEDFTKNYFTHFSELAHLYELKTMLGAKYQETEYKKTEGKEEKTYVITDYLIQSMQHIPRLNLLLREVKGQFTNLDNQEGLKQLEEVSKSVSTLMGQFNEDMAIKHDTNQVKAFLSLHTKPFRGDIEEIKEVSKETKDLAVLQRESIPEAKKALANALEMYKALNTGTEHTDEDLMLKRAQMVADFRLFLMPGNREVCVQKLGKKLVQDLEKAIQFSPADVRPLAKLYGQEVGTEAKAAILEQIKLGFTHEFKQMNKTSSLLGFKVSDPKQARHNILNMVKELERPELKSIIQNNASIRYVLEENRFNINFADLKKLSKFLKNEKIQDLSQEKLGKLTNLWEFFAGATNLTNMYVKQKMQENPELRILVDDLGFAIANANAQRSR